MTEPKWPKPEASKLQEGTNESSRVATEIVNALVSYIGNHEWSGDSPFELRMIDQRSGTGYAYQIRRGGNWVTIQERISNNPQFVKSYTLEEKRGNWDYIDPTLIKYQESSLGDLVLIFERLKVAIEAASSKRLNQDKEGI